MDHKISELNRYWSEMQQTGHPPSVMPKITKSFKPFPEEVRNVRQSVLQRSPSDRSYKSSSLPASRTSSFNRGGDSQRWKKKGPITKHGTRRRTVDSGHAAKDQVDSSRKNDTTGYPAGHNQQEPDQDQQHSNIPQHQETPPHVSQSYYPKSEDFSRQIPTSSYLYDTNFRPDPEPMWEDRGRPSVYQPSEPKFESPPAPQAYSRSEADLTARLESQILPSVSNSLQSAPQNIKPDSSTSAPSVMSSKSSSHYIPDTLPITRSQPDISRTVPPKVDIRPRFHRPRRNESPPLNFKDILSKFEGGDVDKPKDNKDKEAVQKEISEVMKSRASMLDHEDAIQPRSEIIRREVNRPAEAAPAIPEPVKDDGGLKDKMEEVSKVYKLAM